MAFSEVWQGLAQPRRVAPSAWLPDGYAYAAIVLNDFYAPETIPDDGEEEPPHQNNGSTKAKPRARRGGRRR